MFVHNCVIDTGENLYFHTPHEKRKFKKRAERTEPNNITALDEVFHPVSCSECELTLLAVFCEHGVGLALTAAARYNYP